MDDESDFEECVSEGELPERVLRLTSSHCEKRESVVINTPYWIMKDVRDSVQEPFKTEPTAGPGLLDRLPVELALMVLHELDILSLFRFRQVNRRARLLMASLREYTLVAKHGMEALRGLLRGKIAHKFAITELYETLITRDCEFCDNFGGFVFLPLAARCCFDCIRKSPVLGVLCKTNFARLAGKSAMRLEKIAGMIFHTVPGHYAFRCPKVNVPKYLVSYAEALRHLKGAQKVDLSSLKQLQYFSSHVNYRFMVSTALPWYNPDKAEVEPGLRCDGCSYHTERPPDIAFTVEGYLEHFAGCAEAHRWWDQRKKSKWSAEHWPHPLYYWAVDNYPDGDVKLPRIDYKDRGPWPHQ